MHGADVTTPKKPGAKQRAKTKTVNKATSSTQDVWARTQMLVEVLLEVMEREIRTRKNEPSERWLKLFGAKDSAVVNLQKLVHLLAELQSQTPQTVDVTPVDAAELAILAEWLKTTNAANVSTAAE